MPPNSPPPADFPSVSRSAEAGSLGGFPSRPRSEPRTKDWLNGAWTGGGRRLQMPQIPFLHILKVLQMKSDQESRLKVDIFLKQS